MDQPLVRLIVLETKTVELCYSDRNVPFKGTLSEADQNELPTYLFVDDEPRGKFWHYLERYEIPPILKRMKSRK